MKKYITLNTLSENLRAFRNKILKKDIETATKISEQQNNSLVKKSDGFYVPSVDLSDYVEKEVGKSLISDSDITKISDNSDEIEIIKRDYTTKEEFEVVLNKAHNHNNKSVLDDLGTDDEDNLTFKGEPIHGGGGSDLQRETSTVDFNDYDSYEPIVIGITVADEILNLSESSNLAVIVNDDDTTSTLKLDNVSLDVADDYVRNALDTLAEPYESGNGISIVNGVISVNQG